MTYQVTKLLMIIAGAWQLKLGDAPRAWKIIYKIYSWTIFVPFHACTIMFLLKFDELIGVNNDKAIECLSMLIVVFLILIKMILSRLKQMTTVLQGTIELVDGSLKNGNKTAKSLYTNYMQYTNGLNIFLTICCHSVGIYLTIPAILEDREYLKSYETADKDMPQLVGLWYPFPYYEHYKIVRGYECFVVLATNLYYSSLQALANTLLTQTTAEIKLLQHNIRKFTRDDVTEEELSSEKAYFKLRRLIIDHQNIIGRINEINRVLGMILLIEYAVSSFMLATVFVQIVSGKKVIFNCAYFGTMAIGWLMLSYNANEIIIQSSDLSMALYESNWYEQDERTKKLVFIMLMRTQKPLSVQIGPFGPLTLDAAISVTKLLMILAGTWQLKLGDVPRAWKIIYKIYSWIIFVPYHAGTIMFLLKFYELVGVDNDKAVECLSMLVVVFLIIIKMILCRSKQMSTVLQDTIEIVDETLKNGNKTAKSVYTNYMKYANGLNIFLTICSYFVGVYLIIPAILEDKEYMRTHETADTDMPLQVLFWYPFPYYEHYKIVLGYEALAVFTTNLYNSCLQALPNTLLTQTTAEIKVLQHNIRKFTRDDVTGEELSREKAYSKLRGLIIDHQNLIGRITEINRALGVNLLIEYAVSSFMLASIFVQIISGKRVVFNCSYFGTLAIGWLMLSYNANEIIFQSSNLSMALYESHWYEQDERTKKLAFIMLMRTQKPLSMQIGPFGPMTLDAAISRFKLVYSYVSVMSS